MDIFPELVTIDSRNCLDSLVVETIYNLKKLGYDQYQNYYKTVLEDQSANIQDPIKRNKIYLPKTPMKKIKTKDGLKKEFHKNNSISGGTLVCDVTNM